MTAAEIEARIAQLKTEIAALEAAEVSRLTGTLVSKHSYDGHSMEFSQMTSADMTAALGSRRTELARLEGRGGPFGMVR